MVPHRDGGRKFPLSASGQMPDWQGWVVPTVRTPDWAQILRRVVNKIESRGEEEAAGEDRSGIQRWIILYVPLFAAASCLRNFSLMGRTSRTPNVWILTEP